MSDERKSTNWQTVPHSRAVDTKRAVSVVGAGK